jgi:hypothetical protein
VHRPGALERAHLALCDWQDTRARLADVEARMVAVLDGLGLTGLVTTISGLTPVGAAATLAETGDLARFASPRSLVKHAGLRPRDNASGGYQGKTSISGRGRPALRVAAWRAVWAALPNNPVMAARFAHLTTRENNRLARQQARTACAAALLRWIHVVITRQVDLGPCHRCRGPHRCGKLHKHRSAELTTTTRAGPRWFKEHGQPRPSPQRARFTLSGTTRLKARQSTRRRRSTRPDLTHAASRCFCRKEVRPCRRASPRGPALARANPFLITATDDAHYPRGTDALPRLRSRRSRSVVRSEIGHAHNPPFWTAAPSTGIAARGRTEPGNLCRTAAEEMGVPHRAPNENLHRARCMGHP